MAQSTTQALRAAEKLAARYPLFVEQLAPELPKLQAHVEVHGTRDIIPEQPAFAVGDFVRVHKASYTLEYATGMVYKVVPCWSYSGRWSRWAYYVCYGPGQNVPLFHQQIPEFPNERISKLVTS